MATNSTFLHEDKTIPPDEPAERNAPKCSNCDANMWLVRIDKKLSDGKTEASYTYECKQCGALTTRQDADVEPTVTAEPGQKTQDPAK